ncbi:MAG: hypothetical protein J6568_07380 [Snodgrassella sp.]|nr:hypothetical protein [Snodgrassella sp.]
MMVMEKISILKFKHYLEEIFKPSDIDNVLKDKGISPVAIYMLSKSVENCLRVWIKATRSPCHSHRMQWHSNKN